jgi:hypothetical protein
MDKLNVRWKATEDQGLVRFRNENRKANRAAQKEKVRRLSELVCVPKTLFELMP